MCCMQSTIVLARASLSTPCPCAPTVGFPAPQHRQHHIHEPLIELPGLLTKNHWEGLPEELGDCTAVSAHV